MAGVSEASLKALEEEAWEEWDGQGSFLHHSVAGAAAGVAEHVLMFPLDTYKVRTGQERGRGTRHVLAATRAASRPRSTRRAPAASPHPPPAPRRRTSSSPAGRGCRSGA